MNPSVTTCSKVRIQESSSPQIQEDILAVEEPLEIRIKGQSIAVTMRTPGHDDELATGFLLTEGIIHSPAQIAQIEHCQQGQAAQLQNILNVFLTSGTPFDTGTLQRNFYASSSCGVCGKASIESIHGHFPPVTSPVEIAREVIYSLPDKLRAAQNVFEKTGSLHGAGLFDHTGHLLVLREDVGRHNAVDKVIGFAARSNLLPLERSILFVSGRTSFEITQKALAAGIPIIAAVSGPSSLAVDLAQESGQTLIGFLRGRTFNIYCGADRIV